MSIKAKIIKIETAALVATGERYLDVAVELTDGKEKIIRKLGYPMDTSKETILADVQKLADNHKLEKAQREQNSEAEAQDAHATELKDLEGEEVAAPDEVETETKVTVTAKKGAKKNARSKNSSTKRK